MHPGIEAVAVTFWIFVTVVSVAGMIVDYRKRQLALEPLRIAIEHGQQLDPEIITRLLGREDRDDQLDPQLLRTGGIITCASGIGVGLLARFVALVFPPYHWLVLGVGVVGVCVGVGLLIAARSLRRDAASAIQDKVA
ncbi:MAG TPA: hypothetical protein VI653_16500 [Steroidobacteraceae bacterium]